MRQNLANFGLSFRQCRLELCVFSPQLLSHVSQLFLNRADLGQCASRFDGFAKNLLAQLQLLCEYLGSRGRARVHDDLQRLALRFSINRQADLVDSRHSLRPGGIAVLGFFVRARAAGTTQVRFQTKRCSPPVFSRTSGLGNQRSATGSGWCFQVP